MSFLSRWALVLALCSCTSVVWAQAGVERHSTTRAGSRSARVNPQPPRPPVEPVEPVNFNAPMAPPMEHEMSFGNEIVAEQSIGGCECGGCGECGECGPVGCCDVIGPGCGVACGPNCGSCVGPIGPVGGPSFCRPWFRVEYISWWSEGFDAPPLVTTGPDTAGIGDSPGVIGQGGTDVLFGGGPVVSSFRPGTRYTAGYWFDPCMDAGIQASYFSLGAVSDSFSGDQTTNAVLARPFENVEPGSEGEDAELVALPSVYDGRITARGESSFSGVEVLMRKHMGSGALSRIDALAGWRRLSLDEEVFVDDFREVIGTGTVLAVGTTLAEQDRFETESVFNGAVLGMVGQRRFGCYTCEATLKLGLGNVASEARVSGQTTTSVPVVGDDPVVTVTDTGLLAQQSNIGVYDRDDFAVAPELGFTVGWDVSCRLRATLGYTFLYLSRVARPGDLIDREVNLSQLDTLNGVAKPEFEWKMGDLLVQGINIGLEYGY